MGVLAIFLGVLTQIFHSTLNVGLESAASSSVDQVTSYLLSRFQYDIHRATAIVTPASAGQSTTSMTLVIGSNNYTYAVDSSRLTLTAGLATDYLTDSDVAISDFTVTRLGNNISTDSLQISFTITSLTTTTSGATQSRQLQFSVAPR